MGRMWYESAVAPTSHSATDPGHAEFNADGRSKHGDKQTDSNAALLPYLTHKFGSAHEWNDVLYGLNRSEEFIKRRKLAIMHTEHRLEMFNIFIFGFILYKKKILMFPSYYKFKLGMFIFRFFRKRTYCWFSLSRHST